MARGPSSRPARRGVVGWRSWPSLKTDLRNAGAEWVDQEAVVDRHLASSRKPADIPALNREMIGVCARALEKAHSPRGMTGVSSADRRRVGREGGYARSAVSAVGSRSGLADGAGLELHHVSALTFSVIRSSATDAITPAGMAVSVRRSRPLRTRTRVMARPALSYTGAAFAMTGSRAPRGRRDRE